MAVKRLSWLFKEMLYLGDIVRPGRHILQQDVKIPISVMYHIQTPRIPNSTALEEYASLIDRGGQTIPYFANHPVYGGRFSLWTKKDGAQVREHSDKRHRGKPIEELVEADILALLRQPDVPAYVKNVLGLPPAAQGAPNGYGELLRTLGPSCPPRLRERLGAR